MDAFETSLGYRSLDPLTLLEPQAKERFSVEELQRYAKDLFDAHLAEALRTGEWHWKLEIREIAEQVAETLESEEKSDYESLRSAILEHYENQYRVPTPQEYRSYLRGKRAVRASIPQEALYGGDIEVELTGLAMMRQRRTICLSDPLDQSSVAALAKETAGNHVWDYQGMREETIEVTILGRPSFSRRQHVHGEATHNLDTPTSHQQELDEKLAARFVVWKGERLSYSQTFDAHDADGEEQIRAEELIAAHLFDEYEELDLFGHVRWIIAFVVESFFQEIVCRPVEDMLQLMEILPEYLATWQNRLAKPSERPDEEEAAQAGRDALLLTLRFLNPEWVEVDSGH